MNEIDDVRSFHTAFDLPRPWEPALMAPESMAVRIEALNNVFEYYVTACTTNRLAGQADALGALIFLLKSEIVWRGLPWQELWDDTVEAMLKVPPDMHSARHRRISDILAQAGYEASLEAQLPLPLDG